MPPFSAPRMQGRYFETSATRHAYTANTIDTRRRADIFTIFFRPGTPLEVPRESASNRAAMMMPESMRAIIITRRAFHWFTCLGKQEPAFRRDASSAVRQTPARAPRRTCMRDARILPRAALRNAGHVALSPMPRHAQVSRFSGRAACHALSICHDIYYLPLIARAL